MYMYHLINCYYYRDTIEEYIASVDHARRLSVIPDMFKANKKYPADLIRDEDVFTYLRWLTHLFHTTKRVMSFIAVSFCDYVKLLKINF